MFAAIKRVLGFGEGLGGILSVEQTPYGARDPEATLYKTYDGRGALFLADGTTKFYSRFRDAKRGVNRMGLTNVIVLA